MQPLPVGWQAAYTPEGQLYYVDHNTQTTHWTLPPYAQQQMYAGRGALGGRGATRGRGGIDNAKRKTKMCMNYESGACSWGDRCAFAHGSHELTARDAAIQQRSYYQGYDQPEGLDQQQPPQGEPHVEQA